MLLDSQCKNQEDLWARRTLHPATWLRLLPPWQSEGQKR
jgi:hypothetical protein